MMETALKVFKLNKKFKKKTLFEDASFEIKPGEIVGLLGSNGSGKTTLMKMILGLSSFSTGEILIYNHSIKYEREKALKYMNGMVEHPKMYPFLSGRDNMIQFQRISQKRDNKKINELITILKMDSYIDAKTNSYSLGMKQRLGIAIALLNEPEILILDEPLNGLDYESVKTLKKYITQLSDKGTAFIISSHSLKDLENFFHSLIILKNNHLHFVNDISLLSYVEENLFSLKASSLKEAKSVIENHFAIRTTPSTDSLQFRASTSVVPEIIKQLIQHNIDIYSICSLPLSLEEKYANFLSEEK